MSPIEAQKRPWTARPRDLDGAREFAAELSISTAVAALLRQRGVESVEEAQQFLKPSLLELHPPEVIADLERAVDLIFSAKDRGDSICIYGDYDVDGVTGSVILLEALTELGVDARSYIPHRLDEGYGLNLEAVRTLHADGVGLLITVDGGANDRAELELARELGMSVIVTDHHPIEGELADIPVVHPGREDAPSPSATLCGAGVAYKLAWGLGKRAAGGDRVSPRFRSFLEEALALAALGTVADVVPLLGENRAIVAHGLRALGRSPRPGLRALLDVCGLEPDRLTSTDIGFKIGPHLNAAGRMGEVERAVELLRTRDRDRGRVVAAELATLNRRRKSIEQKMTDECLEELEGDLHAAGSGALLFAREGWHSGVAGIVAARLVDRLHRPVFVVAIDGELGRGSGRSIPERPLTDLYDAMRPMVASIGGHACAGGLTLLPDQVDPVRAILAGSGRGEDGEREELPPQEYDLAIPAEEATLELVRDLAAMAPFGAGNPEPIFRVDGLALGRPPRLVGKGEEHLMAQFRHARGTIEAIWFRGAEYAGELIGRDQRSPGSIDLIATLSEDRFRGVSRLRAQIIDLIPTP